MCDCTQKRKNSSSIGSHASLTPDFRKNVHIWIIRRTLAAYRRRALRLATASYMNTCIYVFIATHIHNACQTPGTRRENVVDPGLGRADR